MMYYSAILAITWLALLTLCVLVHENDRIFKPSKRRFYVAYIRMALAALAEWLGFCFDGAEDMSPLSLLLAKIADCIRTPLAGAELVQQMGIRNKWSKALVVVLAANALFQILALFGGWMVTVDEQNHYHHGSLYIVYVAVYLVVLVLVVVECLIYGKSFRRQNRASLYLAMALIIVGVAMQEAIGENVRTVCLSLAFGALLLFIHNAEFTQLTQGESIERQHVQIMTDALTGVRSRFAYSKALKDLAAQGSLPADLVAFSIDVNGLKAVNDSAGHDTGDELICAAAACIQRAFAERGECYRTSDEFVVLANMYARMAGDGDFAAPRARGGRLEGAGYRRAARGGRLCACQRASRVGAREADSAGRQGDVRGEGGQLPPNRARPQEVAPARLSALHVRSASPTIFPRGA